jgi:hypothetical protein
MTGKPAETVADAMAVIVKQREYAESRLAGRTFVNGIDNSELILWCDLASWMMFAEALIITGDRLLAAKAYGSHRTKLMMALKEVGA